MCTPYLYILLFFVLNTVAISAQRVLKGTNRRFQNHGEERRRSIASIFAIVLVKALLLVLAFPVICAIIPHDSWDGTLVTRSHLCAKVLMVAYLFDMDYRRVNAILWLHHTVALAACLFYVHITNPDAPEAGRAWLSLPMVFVGIGVGGVDIAGDVAVLLYYLPPQTQWLAAARAIRACAWYLMLGRVVGWFIVLGILLRGDWQLLELRTGAKIGFSLMLLAWGTAEGLKPSRNFTGLRAVNTVTPASCQPPWWVPRRHGNGTARPVYAGL
ncbi:hypothetical protein B0H11DRAFT_2272666 [Mycena galericulata]|nr:hypothetical protein B0H11DRAFT_2272666 [Mycena galericulata]